MTFKDGVPEQTNYHNYRLIHLAEIPDVEVYFVHSGIEPTGLGESRLCHPPELPWPTPSSRQPASACAISRLRKTTCLKVFHRREGVL